MEKNTLRKAFSFLFTFFIAFFLFVISVMSVIRFTVLDEGYFLNKLDKVKYYENTTIQINRTIQQAARGAGIEPDIFENFIKDENIRESMTTYIRQGFLGLDATIDTTKFETELKTTIQSYIKDQQLQVSVEDQKAINQFVKACIEKYSYMAKFPYIHEYGQLTRLYQKGYMIAIPVLIIVEMLLIYMIYRMHSSRRKRKRYYAYACIGAGLLTLIAPLVMYSFKVFEKINIHPKYMFDLLTTLTGKLLIYCIIIGLIFIILGIGTAYMKSKKKKERISPKKSYLVVEMDDLSESEK